MRRSRRRGKKVSIYAYLEDLNWIDSSPCFEGNRSLAFGRAIRLLRKKKRGEL